MYLSHYNLVKKPFQLTTHPEFLWLGDKHKEALATLKYSAFIKYRAPRGKTNQHILSWPKRSKESCQYPKTIFGHPYNMILAMPDRLC